MLLSHSSRGYKNYIRCSASVPGEVKIAFIHRMGVQTVVIGNVNEVNQGNRIYAIVARAVDKNGHLRDDDWFVVG